MLYDRYGAFEGFVLNTEEGERTLKTARRASRELHIARFRRDSSPRFSSTPVNRMSRATFLLWFFERAFAGSNTETAPRARSPCASSRHGQPLRSVHRRLALATSAHERVPPLGPVSPDGGI